MSFDSLAENLHIEKAMPWNDLAAFLLGCRHAQALIRNRSEGRYTPDRLLVSPWIFDSFENRQLWLQENFGLWMAESLVVSRFAVFFQQDQILNPDDHQWIFHSDRILDPTAVVILY